jgi:hypothetical protein
MVFAIAWGIGVVAARPGEQQLSVPATEQSRKAVLELNRYCPEGCLEA